MSRPMVLLLLAGLLFGSPSYGATLRVPSRYPTIQAGLQAAGPGDTVLVAPGTYFESLAMLSGVTLMSQEGASRTAIDGGGSGRVITCSNASSSTVIQGFTIRNGYSSGGGGIRISGGSPTIQDNIIRDNVSRDDGGGIYCLNCSAHIINNTLESNSANVGSQLTGGALFVYGASHGKVAYNVFLKNSAAEGGAILIATPACSLSVTGNFFWDNNAVWGGAITVGQAAPTIESNTFYANRATSGAAIAFYNGAKPSIIKNIIAGHTSPAILCNAAGVVKSSCNDLWNTGPNYSGCSFDTSADLRLDPLFCDPPYGDFHLELGSPCAGHPVCGLIGAYEPGCLPSNRPHHPQILSVSRSCVAFGQQSTIVFCIATGQGLRVLDMGEPATVSALFGLGTLGTVTELPDTTYTFTYTAGYVPGLDSISVYDPDCGVEQYAWTALDVMPAPKIVSVKDVPGDQGGKVLVRWTRSGLDVSLDSVIAYYSVWRSLDGAGAEESGKSLLVSMAEVSRDFAGPGYRITSSGDKLYYWEWIGNVPAHFFEGYSFAAPTLMDSTAINPGWHHFLVSAHTPYPSVFRDSEPDSGYSVDNIPPSPPDGLAGEYTSPPGQVLITWLRAEETDVSHYAVYRAGDESFAPNESNRVGTPADTFFVDRTFDDAESYYKVSAVDSHGNEGGCSLLRPEDISGAPGSVSVPKVTHLAQNVPNPFNPATTIRFAVAEAGWVFLGVFDVTGRPVRVLVEGRKDARYHSVSWDGRDEAGRPVASGVYLYTLQAPGYAETKKMVLLR